jgi:hypothetical protein
MAERFPAASFAQRSLWFRLGFAAITLVLIWAGIVVLLR